MRSTVTCVVLLGILAPIVAHDSTYSDATAPDVVPNGTVATETAAAAALRAPPVDTGAAAFATAVNASAAGVPTVDATVDANTTNSTAANPQPKVTLSGALVVEDTAPAPVPTAMPTATVPPPPPPAAPAPAGGGDGNNTAAANETLQPASNSTDSTPLPPADGVGGTGASPTPEQQQPAEVAPKMMSAAATAQGVVSAAAVDCGYTMIGSLSPMSIATTLLGTAGANTATLVSASYVGNNVSAGVVKLSSDPSCTHYLKSSFAGADAVVLTTGHLMAAAKTSNTVRNTGSNLGGAGTSYISNSLDAATLSFRIKPKVEGCLSWQFVFASDEYPEYVGSEYNDEFKLLVNGQSVAYLPDGYTNVKISTVNHQTNSYYYTSNWITAGTTSTPGNLATEFDGLTTSLRTKEVFVTANQDVDVVLTIADVQAPTVDSAVFVQAGSLQIRNCTSPPYKPPPVSVASATYTTDWTKRIVWDVLKMVDQTSVDVSNFCKHVNVTYNVTIGLTVQERFIATGAVTISTSENVTIFSVTPTTPGCTVTNCNPGRPSMNLTAGKVLNCSVSCDISSKPSWDVLYYQIGWGPRGSASATNTEWGYMYTNSAQLKLIDPCAYAHDIANGGKPTRLSNTQFCYDQYKGTRQTQLYDSYTTMLTSDECTGRYKAPPASPPGGRRKLQQTCANKKTTSSVAEYKNVAVATRDYDGKDVIVSSNAVVVTMKCPVGCAGANNWLQTATSCCQCSNAQEWNAASKTCVACKTGWALDATYKCASICYSQFGAAKPVYQPPTATAPYKCVPCPAATPDYEPILGVCLTSCPSATPYRVPGTRTCSATKPASAKAMAAAAPIVQPFLATKSSIADMDLSSGVSSALGGDASSLVPAASVVTQAAASSDCAYTTLATQTATNLVTALLGSDQFAFLDLLSASYTGDAQAAGVINLKSDTACNHYLSSVFNTDAVALVTGPISLAAKTQNLDRDNGIALGTSGTPYISNSVDAATLTFRIRSKVKGVLSWVFSFASEEYPESITSAYNDGFELLVDGTPVAYLPDGVTPVKIKNVNSQVNPQYYVSNWNKVGSSSVPGTLKTEFDGLTVPLRTKDVPVSVGQELQITMVVADVGDGSIDSGVYIPMGSLRISPVTVTTSNVSVAWTKQVTWEVIKGSDVCRALSVTTGTVDVSKNEEVTFAVSLIATAQERFTATGNVTVESAGVGIRVFSLTSSGCTFSNCLPAAAPTDLASGQRMTCAFACSWTAKPATASVPIAAGWALTGATAQTAIEQGLIPTGNPAMQLKDGCVYAHDVPNGASRQLMSTSPFCFSATGPNKQVFVLPRYTVTIGKDKCATRYKPYSKPAAPKSMAVDRRGGSSAAAMTVSEAAPQQQLTIAGNVAAAADDSLLTSAPAPVVEWQSELQPSEGAPGGARRLQTFCANTIPKITSAEYTNQVIVTRDINGTSEVARSNIVRVNMTGCPGGCAGPNVHPYADRCCVCAANQQWDTLWGVCLQCKAGWMWDAATNKCASPCKDPTLPLYSGGKCVACPLGADKRMQEYNPATDSCQACKAGFEVSNKTYKCESICYNKNGPQAPVYVPPKTIGGAYSCTQCPALKPIYAVDIWDCVAACPASKPVRVPGTTTCTTAALAVKRTAAIARANWRRSAVAPLVAAAAP